MISSTLCHFFRLLCGTIIKKMKYFTLISLFIAFSSGLCAQNTCQGALPICTNSSTNYYPLGYEIDSTNTNIDYSCVPDSLNQHWYTFLTTGNGDVNLTAGATMGGGISMLVFGPNLVTAPNLCPSYSIPDYCSPVGQTLSFQDLGVAANSIYHVLVLNHSDTTNEVLFNLTGTAFPLPNCPVSVQNCVASTAQYQATFQGQSNQVNQMCFSDTLNIQYQNGTGIYPPEVPTISNILPHNPGTVFFLYWRQPDNYLPPVLDPGFVAPITGSYVDFDVINNEDIQTIFTLYPSLNNTLYLKAFPCYNRDSAYVAHYCYDESSPVIQVQMYDEITIDTLSVDCATNTAEVQFFGGAPEFGAAGGTFFNFSNTSPVQPPNFYLNPNPFQDSTTITMYNLPDTLNPVLFSIVDDIGCKKEFSGFFGAPLPNFNYSDTTFCDNVGAIVPNLNIPPEADLFFQAFDNPNGVSVPVGTNNGIINPQGLGGTSITVDFTASYLGCSRDSALIINIQSAPQIDSLPNQSICPGDSISFNFSSSSSPNLSYSWLNSNPLSGIPASGSGSTFSYGGLNHPFPNSNSINISYWGVNNTCTSDTFKLVLELLPGIQASPDTAVCRGEDVTLQVEGGDDFIWSPDDQLDASNTASPTAVVENSQTIVVEGLTTDNCSASDTVVLELLPLSECIEEPYSAFSPNGDGVNDHWTIPGLEEIPNNNVIIFNRWGDLIVSFESYDNQNVIWDGTNKYGDEIPAGTYFYIIEYEDQDNLKGWVELMK